MQRGLPKMPRSEWEHLIEEWILSEKNRRIMRRKLLDDWSFERIAEDEAMSVNGIKKIVKRCTTALLEDGPPG